MSDDFQQNSDNDLVFFWDCIGGKAQVVFVVTLWPAKTIETNHPYLKFGSGPVGSFHY